MKNSLLKIAVAGVFGAGLATSAHAIDTLVQINHDGVAGYDTTGIQEFDWQSSGDLVIVNELGYTQTMLNGASCTTFLCFAANAQENDVVDFGFQSHARLNDMQNAGGQSVAPGSLNSSGGGAGFEITAAISGVESAKVDSNGNLDFTGITGDYAYFIDQSPDSDVTSGAGFTDGTQFLWGNVGPTVGDVGSFNVGTGGTSFLKNTVEGYLASIIETDPSTNAPLVGTTFDTLVSIVSSLEDAVGVGGLAGLVGYTVVNGDLVFKADANTEFSANPAPAPGTLFILGTGLLGLCFTRRRRVS